MRRASTISFEKLPGCEARAHVRGDADFAQADDFFQNGDVVAQDLELEEEAVELGFGQRVGAFEFDGVLGGQNKEGAG